MSTEETAASEHGADAETTQVPPPPGDEPELAWSVDDDTDEISTNRHGRLMWAGLAVLVVAITAALLLLVSTLFGRHTTNNARPQPVPSPPVTTTVAAAPPPPTVPTTTPPPVGRYAIPACYSLEEPPIERPAAVTFQYCGDGGAQLDHMTWTAWGPSSADGQGYFSFKSCQPSCAQGGWLHYPAQIHAVNPAPPPSRNSGCPADMQFYTDLTLAFPTVAPTGVNGETVNSQYNGLPAIRFSTEPNQTDATQLTGPGCW